MNNKRLLGHDEISGTTEFFHFDPVTEGFTVETLQDVEPLLERNKTLWNAAEKHTKYGEWSRVASIPPVIIMELAKQGILTAAGSILDHKKYRAFLNDPANRHWRTRPGKV